MPSFLGRLLDLNFRTERLIMNLLGLVNSTLDWSPIKWTNKLEQIWNLSLSQGTLILDVIGEDTIKTVLSWIVITRIVIAHVYTFSYMINIYPILTWSRPNLLLPWLMISFFKNIVLEVIVIAVGLLLWYDKRFSLPIFLEFVLVKVVPLIFASYNWYSNSCLFLELRHMEKLRRLRSDSNLIATRLYLKFAESKYRTRSLTTLISYESYETYDTQDTISRIIDDPLLTPAQKTMRILGLTDRDIDEARARKRERETRRRLTEVEDEMYAKDPRDKARYFSFIWEHDWGMKKALREMRSNVMKRESVQGEWRKGEKKQACNLAEDREKWNVSLDGGNKHGKVGDSGVKRVEEAEEAEVKEGNWRTVEEAEKKDGVDEIGEVDEVDGVRREGGNDEDVDKSSSSSNLSSWKSSPRSNPTSGNQNPSENPSPPEDPNRPQEQHNSREANCCPKEEGGGSRSTETMKTKQKKLCPVCDLKDFNKGGSPLKKLDSKLFCARHARRSVEKSCSPVKLQALFNCNCVTDEFSLREKVEEYYCWHSSAILRTSTPNASPSKMAAHLESDFSNADLKDSSVEVCAGENVPETREINKDDEVNEKMDLAKGNSLPLIEKLFKQDFSILKNMRKKEREGARLEGNASEAEGKLATRQAFKVQEGEIGVLSKLYAAQRSAPVGVSNLTEIVKDLGVTGNVVTNIGTLKGAVKSEETEGKLKAENQILGSAISIPLAGGTSVQRATVSPLKQNVEKNVLKVNLSEYSFGDTNIQRFYKDSMKVFDGCYEKDFANNSELQCLLQQLEKKKWSIFPGQPSQEILLPSAYLKQHDRQQANRSTAAQEFEDSFPVVDFEKKIRHEIPASSSSSMKAAYDRLISQIVQANEKFINDNSTSSILHSPSQLDFESSTRDAYTQTYAQSQQLHSKEPRRSSSTSLSEASKHKKTFLKRKRLKEQSRSLSPIGNLHPRKSESRNSILKEHPRLASRQKLAAPKLNDAPGRPEHPGLGKSASEKSFCECKTECKRSNSSGLKSEKREDGKRCGGKCKVETFGTIPLSQVVRPSMFDAIVYRRKPPAYPRKAQEQQEAHRQSSVSSSTSNSNSSSGGKKSSTVKRLPEAAKKPTEKQSSHSSKKLKWKSKMESVEEQEAREMRALKAYNEVTLLRDKKEMEARRKLPSKKNSVDLEGEGCSKSRAHAKRNEHHRGKKESSAENAELLGFLDKENLVADATTETEAAFSDPAREHKALASAAVKLASVSSEKHEASKMSNAHRLADKLLENFDRLRGGKAKQESRKGKQSSEADARKQYTRYSKAKKLADEENSPTVSMKKLEGSQMGRELERTPAREDVRERTRFPILANSVKDDGAGKVEEELGENDFDKPSSSGDSFGMQNDGILTTIKCTVVQDVASSWSTSTVDQEEEMVLPVSDKVNITIAIQAAPEVNERKMEGEDTENRRNEIHTIPEVEDHRKEFAAIAESTEREGEARTVAEIVREKEELKATGEKSADEKSVALTRVELAKLVKQTQRQAEAEKRRGERSEESQAEVAKAAEELQKRSERVSGEIRNEFAKNSEELRNEFAKISADLRNTFARVSEGLQNRFASSSRHLQNDPARKSKELQKESARASERLQNEFARASEELQRESARVSKELQNEFTRSSEKQRREFTRASEELQNKSAEATEELQNEFIEASEKSRNIYFFRASEELRKSSARVSKELQSEFTGASERLQSEFAKNSEVVQFEFARCSEELRKVFARTSLELQESQRAELAEVCAEPQGESFGVGTDSEDSSNKPATDSRESQRDKFEETHAESRNESARDSQKDSQKVESESAAGSRGLQSEPFDVRKDPVDSPNESVRHGFAENSTELQSQSPKVKENSEDSAKESAISLGEFQGESARTSEEFQSLSTEESSEESQNEFARLVRRANFHGFARNVDMSFVANGIFLNGARNSQEGETQWHIVDDNTIRRVYNAFSYRSDAIFDLSGEFHVLEDLLGNRTSPPIDDFIYEPLLPPSIPPSSREQNNFEQTILDVVRQLQNIEEENQEEGPYDLFIATIDHGGLPITFETASDDTFGDDGEEEEEEEDGQTDILSTVTRILRIFNIRGLNFENILDGRLEMFQQPLPSAEEGEGVEVGEEEEDEEEVEEEEEFEDSQERSLEEERALRFIKEDVCTDIRFPISVRWSDLLPDALLDVVMNSSEEEEMSEFGWILGQIEASKINLFSLGDDRDEGEEDDDDDEDGEEDLRKVLGGRDLFYFEESAKSARESKNLAGVRRSSVLAAAFSGRHFAGVENCITTAGDILQSEEEEEEIVSYLQAEVGKDDNDDDDSFVSGWNDLRRHAATKFADEILRIAKIAEITGLAEISTEVGNSLPSTVLGNQRKGEKSGCEIEEGGSVNEVEIDEEGSKEVIIEEITMTEDVEDSAKIKKVEEIEGIEEITEHKGGEGSCESKKIEGDYARELIEGRTGSMKEEYTMEGGHERSEREEKIESGRLSGKFEKDANLEENDEGGDKSIPLTKFAKEENEEGEESARSWEDSSLEIQTHSHNVEEEKEQRIEELKREISLGVIFTFWFLVVSFYVRYLYQTVFSFKEISTSTSTLKPFEIHTVPTSTTTILQKSKLLKEIKEEEEEKEDEEEDEGSDSSVIIVDLEEIQFSRSSENRSSLNLDLTGYNTLLSVTNCDESSEEASEKEDETEETVLNRTYLDRSKHAKEEEGEEKGESILPPFASEETSVAEYNNSDSFIVQPRKEETEEGREEKEQLIHRESFEKDFHSLSKTSSPIKDPTIVDRSPLDDKNKLKERFETDKRRSPFDMDDRRQLELRLAKEEIDTFRYEEDNDSSSSKSLPIRDEDDKLLDDIESYLPSATVKMEKDEAGEGGEWKPDGEEESLRLEGSDTRRKLNSTFNIEGGRREKVEEAWASNAEETSASKEREVTEEAEELESSERNVSSSSRVSPGNLEAADSFDSAYSRFSDASKSSIRAVDLNESSMEEFTMASDKSFEHS